MYLEKRCLKTFLRTRLKQTFCFKRALKNIFQKTFFEKRCFKTLFELFCLLRVEFQFYFVSLLLVFCSCLVL